MTKIAILTSTFADESTEAGRLLSSRGYQIVRNPHGRKTTVAETLEIASSAEGVIAGLESYDRTVLGKLSSLRVISRVGVGTDAIDLEEIDRRRIRLFTTPEAVVQPVAELTVGLILSLARHLTFHDAALKAGRWERKQGMLLEGRRVGLVGYGRIGRRVGEILTAFGCRVSAFDPVAASGGKAERAGSLNQLLAESDIVSLHASAKPGAAPLIGADQLSHMKPTAYLVNTSRGSLVDEKALYEALKAKRLAGAALDVFTDEPYKGPLQTLENVLLTAHIGSMAKESRQAMEMEAVQNLLKGLST